MLSEIEKFKKRLILEANKFKGKMAEEAFVLSATMQGKEVIRTGRGHDFKVRTRDWLTGKVKKTEYYEVKSSSTAPLSKLQKKMKTKRKNYRIWRPWM